MAAIPNYYYNTTYATTSASTLTWNSVTYTTPAPPPRPRTSLDRLDEAIEHTCARARKAIG